MPTVSAGFVGLCAAWLSWTTDTWRTTPRLRRLPSSRPQGRSRAVGTAGEAAAATPSRLLPPQMRLLPPSPPDMEGWAGRT